MSGRLLENLRKTVRDVPPPASYFRGRTSESVRLVDNLLLFTRTTRTELQRSTFESRPHHRYVLVMALECGGDVSIDGKCFSLSPGQGILIFPYQFHQYLEIPSEEIVWLFMTFEHPDYAYLAAFRNVVFTLSGELLELLGSIVSSFINGTGSSHDEEIMLLSTLFLKRLKDQAGRKTSPGQAPVEGEADSKARELLAVVERSLGETSWPSFPTTTEVAATAGYSESRLRALFKQHVGMSLGSYLRIYQIHRAIRLMKEPRLALAEVASRAGFTSTTSFSRAFKAYTGTTPREFRAKMIGHAELPDA